MTDHTFHYSKVTGEDQFSAIKRLNIGKTYWHNEQVVTIKEIRVTSANETAWLFELEFDRPGGRCD